MSSDLPPSPPEERNILAQDALPEVLHAKTDIAPSTSSTHAAPPEPPAPIGPGAWMFLVSGNLFLSLCGYIVFVTMGILSMFTIWVISAALLGAIRGLEFDALKPHFINGSLSAIVLCVIITAISSARFLSTHDEQARLTRSLKAHVFLRLCLLVVALFVYAALPLELFGQKPQHVAMASTCAVLVAGVGYTWSGHKLLWRFFKELHRRCRQAPFWGGALSAASNMALAACMVTLFSIRECSESLSEMNMMEREDTSALSFLDAIVDFAEQEDFKDCLSELHQAQTAPQIYRLQRKNVPEEDAEDLVHDTMFRVCHAHARSTKDDLVPYFVKSVSNAHKSYAKSRYRDPFIGQPSCHWEHIGQRIHDPEESLFARLTLEEALCNLEFHEEQTLQFMRDGLTYEEISRKTGLSKEAARQQRHRLSKKLRRAMDRD